MPDYPFFEIIDFRYNGLICPRENKRDCTVNIKMVVNGNESVQAAEGEGVVNAADEAMKKAIRVAYFDIDAVRLIDFNCVALDVAISGSSAKVQTSIICQYKSETKKFTGKNHDQAWSGVLALIKAYNYFLAKMNKK
jgi:2-isopropylmalate synthase